MNISKSNKLSVPKLTNKNLQFYRLENKVKTKGKTRIILGAFGHNDPKDPILAEVIKYQLLIKL